jgi:hypothetical protein
MKRTYLNAAGPLLSSVLMLAACGGANDNDAGSPTPFSLSVTTLTFKAATGAPAGECVAGASGIVFVYGGAAPYRLDNGVPDAVVLNPSSEVSDRGGSFSVTVTGACINPGIITVIDKLDHQVTLKVINSASS